MNHLTTPPCKRLSPLQKTAATVAALFWIALIACLALLCMIATGAWALASGK